jgi:hypothetical protein
LIPTFTLLPWNVDTSQFCPVVVEGTAEVTVTAEPLKAIVTFWEGADPPVCALKVTGFGVAVRFALVPLPTNRFTLKPVVPADVTTVAFPV